LGLTSGDSGPLDTEERLADLVVRSDDGALGDLRARVLEPIAHLAPGVQEKLTDTLRAWVLHNGRRDRVAEALFVHPQTVRYRMGQLRDLYGARLEDPRTVLELTLALGIPMR
jgi:DNA-binding PucR family transcriptional regulator